MKKKLLFTIASLVAIYAATAQVAFQRESTQDILNSALLTPASANGTNTYTLYLLVNTDEIPSQAQLEYVFNTNPEFAQFVNANFKPVLIDQHDEKWLNWRYKLRVKQLPAIAVFNENDYLLGRIHGYKSAVQLVNWLKFITSKRLPAEAIQTKTKEAYPDFYKDRMMQSEVVIVDTAQAKNYMMTLGTSSNEVAWNMAREFYPLLENQALRLYDNAYSLMQFYGFELFYLQDDYATYVADTLKPINNQSVQQTIIPMLTAWRFGNIDRWSKFIAAHQAVYRKDWKSTPEAIISYAADSANMLFRIDSLVAWSRFIYEQAADKPALLAAEKVLRENSIVRSRADYMALLGLIQYKIDLWRDAEQTLKAAQRYNLLIRPYEQQINQVLAEIALRKLKSKKK